MNHPKYQSSKLVLLNLTLINKGKRTTPDSPEPNFKAEGAERTYMELCDLCAGASELSVWVSVVALVRARLSGVLKPGPPFSASACLGSGVLLYPGQLIFMTWAWPSLAAWEGNKRRDGALAAFLLTPKSQTYTHTCKDARIKQIRLFADKKSEISQVISYEKQIGWAAEWDLLWF